MYHTGNSTDDVFCEQVENPQYSADYLDPDRRSVTNAVQVHFNDRTSTSKVEVEYPLGHRRRRTECFPALEKKLMSALATRCVHLNSRHAWAIVLSTRVLSTG